MNSLKRSLFVVGLCASVVALVASGETSGVSDSGASNGGAPSGKSNPPENDVEIATCTTDGLGSPEATVKVTNNSSKPSNYIIEIAFESPDGLTQIDSSMVAVNNLNSGQSTTEKAVSFKDAPAKFVCKIIDVTRYAS